VIVMEERWGGIGAYTASPVLIVSDGAKPGVPKRLAFHFEDGNGDFLTRVATDPSNYVFWLARAGFTVVAARYGASTWTSDAQRAAANALYVSLAGVWGTTTKVLAIGRGMGGANALRWCNNNPSLVAGLVTDSGALDMDYCRGTDGVHGPYYTAINTALGITDDAGWATARAAHNPTSIAGSYPDVASLHGGWTTDAFVGNYASTVTNFVNALAAGPKAKAQVVSKAGSSHCDTLTPAQVLTFAAALSY
jgi:dienelactone hydrolase